MVEEKARRYVTYSRGQIVAVLIIKIQYPMSRLATVSLLVADTSQPQGSPRWAHRDDVFYDGRLEDQLDGPHQPTGRVALYLSDLLSPGRPVPSGFSRPTAAEIAAGISRYVCMPGGLLRPCYGIFSPVWMTNLAMAVLPSLSLPLRSYEPYSSTPVPFIALACRGGKGQSHLW